MPARRTTRSRKAVEDAYGRNCVAALPSGAPVERLRTPWGSEVLALRDPDRRELGLLAVPDGPASIRFWLSPCGDHAVAWGAGDVAHFQLFCGLMDRGWHQGRIELIRKKPPVITVQDPVAEILIAGEAASRMAGGPFVVHAGGRVLSGPLAPDAPSP